MKLTQLVIHLDLSDARGCEDIAHTLAVLRDVVGGQDIPIHVEGVLNKPLTSESVRALAVSPRVASALINAGIHTIGQILPLTPNQIREVPDIGRAGAKSITAALKALHLR